MSTTLENRIKQLGYNLTNEQFKKYIVYDLGHKISKECKKRNIIPIKKFNTNYYDFEKYKFLDQMIIKHLDSKLNQIKLTSYFK